MTMISARGLTFDHGGHRGILGLDLAVPRGRSFGFLGANGAGKTTTLELLTGLRQPQGGDVRVAGCVPGRDQGALARRMGVVLAENHLPDPHLSPKRYLQYFGTLQGLAPQRIASRTKSLFKILRLEDDARRPIRTLSGGNRRKVELARALLHTPQVLFLDEPTRELDLPTRRRVWSFLQQVRKRSNTTLFVCTHDPQEVQALCSHALTLHKGSPTWTGPVASLGHNADEVADTLVALMEAPRPEARGGECAD